MMIGNAVIAETRLKPREAVGCGDRLLRNENETNHHRIKMIGIDKQFEI
jgi:hypothetical protein